MRIPLPGRPQWRYLRENYRHALPEWSLACAFLAMSVIEGVRHELPAWLSGYFQSWIAYELLAIVLVPPLLWVIQPVEKPRPPRWIRLSIVAVALAVFLNVHFRHVLQFGWPFVAAKIAHYLVGKATPQTCLIAAATSMLQVVIMVFIAVAFALAMLFIPKGMTPAFEVAYMLYAAVYFSVIGAFMTVKRPLEETAAEEEARVMRD